jgi:hypothetical protein
LTIVLSQRVAIRATDKNRFGLLLLVLYIQVDLTQTLLFLQADILSSEFFLMILIQEVASLMKNCGGPEFGAWLIGWRYKFPLGDEEAVNLLLKKGLLGKSSH